MKNFTIETIARTNYFFEKGKNEYKSGQKMSAFCITLKMQLQEKVKMKKKGKK